MKLFTRKTAVKFSQEFGKINQVTYYFLGVKFWTENYLIEIEPIKEEPKYSYDIEEMTGYMEWRQKMHLMRLEDEEFMQIINTRF